MTHLSAVYSAFSVIAAFGLTVSVANARLPEAFSNVSIEIVKSAVHMPTGCMASVVFDKRNLVSAKIVDPDCLPSGVKSQRVPGGLHDFAIIETAR